MILTILKNNFKFVNFYKSPKNAVILTVNNDEINILLNDLKNKLKQYNLIIGQIVNSRLAIVKNTKTFIYIEPFLNVYIDPNYGDDIFNMAYYTNENINKKAIIKMYNIYLDENDYEYKLKSY